MRVVQEYFHDQIISFTEKGQELQSQIYISVVCDASYFQFVNCDRDPPVLPKAALFKKVAVVSSLVRGGGQLGGAKYLGPGLVWGARNLDKTSGHCATVKRIGGP